MAKEDKKNQNIVIYTLPTCPWCIKTKEFLKKYKIKSKNKDVSKNKRYVDEMIKKSGQQGTPVIDINGKIIVGFDEDKLKRILNL